MQYWTSTSYKFNYILHSEFTTESCNIELILTTGVCIAKPLLCTEVCNTEPIFSTDHMTEKALKPRFLCYILQIKPLWFTKKKIQAHVYEQIVY